MNCGLTDITIARIREVLAAFPEIDKAILYGSRAKGNFKTGSDIDLTLCGDAITSDVRAKAASALDDLLLPYTIDLSVFNELRHEPLRQHIARIGVPFYERTHQAAVPASSLRVNLNTEERYQEKCVPVISERQAQSEED